MKFVMSFHMCILYTFT